MINSTWINPDGEYVVTAPGQYKSEAGAVDNASRYLGRFGQTFLISGGTRAMAAVEPRLCPGLAENGLAFDVHRFKGECCNENVMAIVEHAHYIRADAIVGVGGGKSIDTAKRAAEICDLPVICIPTIAATCAAASGVSIMYNQEGVHQQDHYLKNSPRLVLVDPDIIAHAPAEYFQSGVLDSLSKWYEGRAAFGGIASPNVFSRAALQMAALLNEIMEQHGAAAVDAVRAGKATESVQLVVDLNVYLAAVIQGIGKKTRGAGAHGLHTGMSVIAGSHEVLHGLKVGYGIVVQLVLEGRPETEIRSVVQFFRELGLEPSLAGLGLYCEPAELAVVAEKAIASQPMQNLPFPVSVEQLVDAMLKTEAWVPTVEKEFALGHPAR